MSRFFYRYPTFLKSILTSVYIAKYVPNGIGNKPITVGHSFSVVAALPEKTEKNSPPWVIPLLIRRVPTWLLRLGYYKLTLLCPPKPKEKASDWVWIIDHTVQIGIEK